MADIPLSQPQLSLAKPLYQEQIAGMAGENLLAGDVVYIDSVTGYFKKASASTAVTAESYGIVVKDCDKNMPCTVFRSGNFGGFDLTTNPYWGVIYLSDTFGRIADSPGTISKVLGHVVPAYGQALGSAPDKLVMLEY